MNLYACALAVLALAVLAFAVRRRNSWRTMLEEERARLDPSAAESANENEQRPT